MRMILNSFKLKWVFLAIIFMTIFLVVYALGAKIAKQSALKDTIKIQEELFMSIHKANDINRETEKKLSAAVNDRSQYKKELDYANKQFNDVSDKLRNGYGLRVKTDNSTSRLPANPGNTAGTGGEARTGFLEKSDESFLVSEANRADKVVALLSQCQRVLFTLDELIGESGKDVVF